MSKAKLCVGLCIGKCDLDIAAWLNMLKQNKLPITTWICNVVNAFVADQPLDIGTVHVQDTKPEVKKESAKVHANLMFGSGSSLMGNTVEEKHTGQTRGWSVKGDNGEYVAGSTVPLHIYNEQTSFALKQMKNNGMAYSSFLKAVIREYLKTGEQDIPPKLISEKAADLLSLSSVDKKSLQIGKTTSSQSNSSCEPTQRNSPGVIEQERQRKKNSGSSKKRAEEAIQEPENVGSKATMEEPAMTVPHHQTSPAKEMSEGTHKRDGNRNPLLSMIR